MRETRLQNFSVLCFRALDGAVVNVKELVARDEEKVKRERRWGVRKER